MILQILPKPAYRQDSANWLVESIKFDLDTLKNRAPAGEPGCKVKNTALVNKRSIYFRIFRSLSIIYLNMQKPHKLILG